MRKKIVDDTPAHRKLGYQHNLDRERIRKDILGDARDGYQFDSEVEFEITKRLEQEHKDNPTPTMQERQAVWRAKHLSNSTFSGNMSLSAEQLSYIIDMFGESNNPIALAIAAKAFGSLDNQDDFYNQTKDMITKAEEIKVKFPDLFK